MILEVVSKIPNKETEVFKVLMSHRIWVLSGDNVAYSCVPSVWELLQLTSKPVIYLCLPPSPPPAKIIHAVIKLLLLLSYLFLL